MTNILNIVSGSGTLGGWQPQSALAGLLDRFTTNGRLDIGGLGNFLGAMSGKDASAALSLMNDFSPGLAQLKPLDQGIFARNFAAAAGQTGAVAASSSPTPPSTAKPLAEADLKFWRENNYADTVQKISNAQAKRGEILEKIETNPKKATKLTKDVAEIDQNIAGLKATKARLEDIELRADSLIEGRTYTVPNKVTVIENGKQKTVNQPEMRTIMPMNHAFSSAEEARDNAIAHAYAEKNLFQDNWERGGVINKQADGTYVATSKLGSEGSSIWNKGSQAYKGVESGRPFVPHVVPNDATVAQWHIHPKGEPEDANFSGIKDKGDLQIFEVADAKQTKKGQSRLTYYLGGNDGSLDSYRYSEAAKKYVRDDGNAGYFSNYNQKITLPK